MSNEFCHCVVTATVHRLIFENYFSKIAKQRIDIKAIYQLSAEKTSTEFAANVIFCPLGQQASRKSLGDLFAKSYLQRWPKDDGSSQIGKRRSIFLLLIEAVSAKADQATTNSISAISKAQTRNRVVRRVIGAYVHFWGRKPQRANHQKQLCGVVYRITIDTDTSSIITMRTTEI